jgi:PAS domain-containing protein
LQNQVSQLADENEMLKNVIRQRFDDETKNKILLECKSISTASSSVISTSNDSSENSSSNDCATTKNLEALDFKLISAIQNAQRSFVITDPSLPDNPIIFASQGFLEMSKYSFDEVIGRNCRFMQGPGTDAVQVETLRKGISEGIDTSVCLLNYKADGTKFFNQVFVAALRDASMKIINYVGVQVEVYFC